MKKQFRISKWYWWIPIIGFLFVKQFSKWIFDVYGVDSGRRLIISEFIAIYHIFWSIFIDMVDKIIAMKTTMEKEKKTVHSPTI